MVMALACPDIHYSLGGYARKGYDESCKQLRHDRLAV